ncbi:MAG: 1-(5-phosphoribosyl)-5-[(5-phosphoribosylamino)methylideneamino] imidazole-4-carboxamide isomerase [Thermoanaerobacterales bacterium 50_218]|nr:MAG: 1-(5-phosphoribosyl)-5-[(5-phosphoribosylamino)methylideneamino] imidazole-4-carboxamide isomerase [Thermoanaerobacterales bacterium 50_218]HAA90724.1 1-(5-phosphoribosyl)-5-((5-phosphoribosylamino)methylideneamino)imidazole-4-carboxamide isomerase [Peptococcaceae bacterium]
MLIIPAIDLRDGKCVRLTQGREDAETVYSADPVVVAEGWVARGARWLHVVDLDGAFTGKPCQLELVKKIVEAVSVPVQLGGGLRRLEDIEAALNCGVERVVLGTVAVSNPGLVREACYLFGGERIVVGLDVRGGFVAVKGWKEETAKSALEIAAEIREMGVERVVFTDTSRDGTLAGPNLAAIEEFARKSGLRVIASGGVSSLDDLLQLKALEPLGVEGVILGKALYEGKVELEEALSAVSG